MKEGLEKSCKDANIERKDELVEDTVDLIRMIASTDSRAGGAWL
jgi:hypothetical protein